MHRNLITSIRSTVVLMGLGLMLAACSAGGSAPPSTPLPSPVEATPVASGSDLQIDETNNGGSVAVAVGSEVTLKLGSTYWQVQGSSDPAVLALVPGPTTPGAAPMACVPGAGCGTVTAVFRALAPGSATITASRTTCGEALLCTGAAGTYKVTVDVHG